MQPTEGGRNEGLPVAHEPAAAHPVCSAGPLQTAHAW